MNRNIEEIRKNLSKMADALVSMSDALEQYSAADDVCQSCHNAKVCKENNWEGCIYEPHTNVISVYDGVSEAVRCAMCNNPNKSDRGCDGACSYDETMYRNIMTAVESCRIDSKDKSHRDCIEAIKLLWINNWVTNEEFYRIDKRIRQAETHEEMKNASDADEAEKTEHDQSGDDDQAAELQIDYDIQYESAYVPE